MYEQLLMFTADVALCYSILSTIPLCEICVYEMFMWYELKTEQALQWLLQTDNVTLWHPRPVSFSQRCSFRKQAALQADRHTNPNDNWINGSLVQGILLSVVAHIHSNSKNRIQFLKSGPLLLGERSKVLLYALLGKLVNLNTSHRLKPSCLSLSLQKYGHLHKTHMTLVQWALWAMSILIKYFELTLELSNKN